MLHWVLVFLIVSLVAAVFGFTDIASTSKQIAKIIFYIFLIMFAFSLIMHLIW